MSTATTRPTFRELVRDGLEYGYWHHREKVAECKDCARNPAGVCIFHRDDNDAAFFFDEARKLLENQPGHPDVLAAFAGLDGAT